MPVEDDATLPKGWTRNVVNVPVAPRLSGQERIDFIKRKWQEVSYEHKLDPTYSICAPYWHAVVDTEYEARRAGDFLRTGAREPTPELSITDDERDGEEDDDDNDYGPGPACPCTLVSVTVPPHPTGKEPLR